MEINMKAAPYSKTSDGETASIKCLRNFLDENKIKSHIKEGDKIPNQDGFLEILDENHIPKGKMTLQVRSIPSGATRYRCPTGLIAYSRSLSEPFLLICVDCKNKRIFWKHLHPKLVEFEKNINTKKSFTINFSEEDILDEKHKYINHWSYICTQYNSKVHDALSSVSDNEDLENAFYLNVLEGELMIKCNYCGKEYYIRPQSFIWKEIEHITLNQYHEYSYESILNIHCNCSRSDEIHLQVFVSSIDGCPFGLVYNTSEKIIKGNLCVRQS